MSTTIYAPPATGDDFDAWENELSQDRHYRPTKAAQRREDREQVLQGLGFRRHRSTEREG